MAKNDWSDPVTPHTILARAGAARRAVAARTLYELNPITLPGVPVPWEDLTPGARRLFKEAVDRALDAAKSPGRVAAMKLLHHDPVFKERLRKSRGEFTPAERVLIAAEIKKGREHVEIAVDWLCSRSCISRIAMEDRQGARKKP